MRSSPKGEVVIRVRAPATCDDAARAGAHHPTAATVPTLFLFRRFCPRRCGFAAGCGLRACPGRDGRCRDTLTALENRLHRASLRHAFAANVFEQIGLT